ncbi:MAG: helix-turn-helix domain-containing protein [Pseudomonadota bacterium]
MAGKDWKGDVAFSHSMAIYRGDVGDHHLHSHWASQLTISLDSELVFDTGSAPQSAKAVYFPSKTPHHLESGFICSIYFDPLAEYIPQVLRDKPADEYSPLSLDELPEELATIDASTDLHTLLDSESLRPASELPSDPRLEAVIQAIKDHHAKGEDIDRNSLAEIVHLSPTRFSHWFVERTGVPLKSYKKWLKLRVAVDAVLAGKMPMEAAMTAGFSDLSHMSRAFAESFGLTYMDALRAWESFQAM